MGEFLLSEIKAGESCVIEKYKETTPIKIKRRMLELGFIKGVNIYVGNISFLNAVMLIELNGYTLSLRKTIANNIYVKNVKNERDNTSWKS